MGACSWNYPSWKGLVYNPERRGKRPSGAELLAEYARRHDTVEVDRWFWSLFETELVWFPDPANAEAYRRAVPDDFRFTLKGPNAVTLTYYYRKEKGEPLRPNSHFLSAEKTAEFLSLLEPVRALCGPGFFQFEYLNKQKMQGAARFREFFGAFRKNLPEGWSYGLETRSRKFGFPPETAAPAAGDSALSRPSRREKPATRGTVRLSPDDRRETGAPMETRSSDRSRSDRPDPVRLRSPV